MHFKSWEKRLEIWLNDMANILVGVKVSDVQYSLVSWGKELQWLEYLLIYGSTSPWLLKTL